MLIEGVPGAASAACHESPRIMLAAVKFFLGQDEAADNSDDEGDEEAVKAVNPTRAEIYNASKKASSCGTRGIHLEEVSNNQAHCIALPLRLNARASILETCNGPA